VQQIAKSGTTFGDSEDDDRREQRPTGEDRRERAGWLTAQEKPKSPRNGEGEGKEADQRAAPDYGADRVHRVSSSCAISGPPKRLTGVDGGEGRKRMMTAAVS
jgi:hypothetical protein